MIVEIFNSDDKDFFGVEDSFQVSLDCISVDRELPILCLLIRAEITEKMDFLDLLS